jgi:hypothetical protein
MTMSQLVGDKGTFGAKLVSCEQQGFLSADEQERLSTAIDMGSAAAHRGFTPKLRRHINAFASDGASG